MESVATLTARDAGELLTLQRAAYVTEAQAHDDPILPPLTQTLTELVDELSDPAVAATGLRDTNGRLVAAVRVQTRADIGAVDIGRLIVAPDRQGRGLGTRLLSHVERGLSEPVTVLRLFTGEHSAGNLRLYRRLGFQETHRTPTPAGYALVHLAKTITTPDGPVA
ncbi:N-acetyltransferase [Prescottella sp. R16]|uniref:GNAT family N-acetyltransferase n=1 Tax=Prescottella sp. R16 TaxID=3064529 RepID=UPI00272ED1E4|nr:GNAT family N-acetyltransferase [Prescottella sp. R16]